MRGVAELRLCALDRRGIALDRRLELIDRRLLPVDVLLRLEALVAQRAEPDEVLLGSDELSFVLRFLRLGLIERRLEQAWIDPGEHVAFADLLSFRERHLLQRAVDLRMDRHGVRCLHRAEAADIDRYIVASDVGHRHLHGRRLARLRRMRTIGRVAPPDDGRDRADEHRGGEPHPRSSPSPHGRVIRVGHRIRSGRPGVPAADSELILQCGSFNGFQKLMLFNRLCAPDDAPPSWDECGVRGHGGRPVSAVMAGSATAGATALRPLLPRSRK